MRRSIGAGIVLVGAATWASAHHEREFVPPGPFQMAGQPIGGAAPAAATPAFLASGRIAAAGDRALVIDADSGDLLLDGAKPAQLAIGHDAGMLAYDPDARLAYVADRRGDRIVVVGVGETLAQRTTWKTDAEPYAVALTPDRQTALVTMIADRKLVAYDVATGKPRWFTKLGAEPRGIAVSHDGARALVTYLAAGMVDQITLADHVAHHVGVDLGFGAVRGEWATAFMGDDLAIVPFQSSRPVGPQDGENPGSYGGSFFPPISHHVAFLDLAGDRQATAQISAQQPRALAWDDKRDALYIAGLGNDSLVSVNHASQLDATEGFAVKLGGKQACGPDGVAVAPDGKVLVWCALSRSVSRITVGAKPTVAAGDALIASALDDKQHLGMELFYTSSVHVSNFGQIACANCHLDGRADGLSWQIHGQQLQTPMLAARLVGTEPFKWDGTAKDLKTSVRATVDRLGGDGLSAKHVDALVAYLEPMAAVRKPTRDPVAVKRGEVVFDAAGCNNCHSGPMYTDQATHKLAGTLTMVDTPSLVGLAASAPYFHDGSAATLEAVLRERGGVHGMSETSKLLSEGELRDLIVFLESL